MVWYVIILPTLPGLVYSSNLQSLQELKHNTEQAVANIDPDTIRGISSNTLSGGDLSSGRRWTF